MVKFAKIEACELLDFLEAVDKCVSVDKQLARGLGDVEVVLEELLNCEQSLLIERLDRALLEYFAQECLAEGGRQMIDKPCDAEVFIADNGLVGVEYLSDLEGDLSLFKRNRERADRVDNGADSDIYASFSWSASSIFGLTSLIRTISLSEVVKTKSLFLSGKRF